MGGKSNCYRSANCLAEPELTMNRFVYVYNCSKGRSRIVSKDQGNIRDVLLDKTMRCHRCVPYSSTEPERPTGDLLSPGDSYFICHTTIQVTALLTSTAPPLLFSDSLTPLDFYKVFNCREFRLKGKGLQRCQEGSKREFYLGIAILRVPISPKVVTKQGNVISFAFSNISYIKYIAFLVQEPDDL
jgi:hypothetical protein